jgi:hypothetical protein
LRHQANGSQGASVRAALFFDKSLVVRFGGLFLTENASFTLALHWGDRFPLRFPDSVDQEEVRPLASFYSK